MKFTIEEPVTDHRSIFVIRAEFTKFDGFESVDWEFRTTGDMVPVVTFLDALLSQGPRPYLRLSPHVPWKELPCSWVADPTQMVPPGITGFEHIEWPEDEEGLADLDTYVIVWYDDKGYEHSVRVDK